MDNAHTADDVGIEDSATSRTRLVRLAQMREELSAPVAAIVGYAEMLVDDLAPDQPDVLAKDLIQIRTCAYTLSESIDEFLDPIKANKLFAHDDTNAVQRRIRHDLRTPINGIKGYAELILEDMDDDALDGFFQNLEILLTQTNALLARLGDIVNFSNANSPTTKVGTAVCVADQIVEAILPVSESQADADDTGHILIVDDIQANRELLSRQLTRQGHTVVTVGGGHEALEVLPGGGFDLVLLDLMMPDITGYEVLVRIKQDEVLRNIPVIMISALDEVDSVVRCIEAGANDYLHKPVNPILLKARIKSGLETKQWLDTERQQKRFIREAFSRFLSEAVVDALVADPSRLELNGERVEITCLFSDLEGFTSLIEGAEPNVVLPLLNRYLDGLCRIVLQYGGTIDKIVGDALHVFFGAPVAQPSHASLAIDCALAMDEFAQAFIQTDEAMELNFGRTRIGVHTGFAVVGNFGGDLFFDYTAHGDSVNTSARMESANKYLGTSICVSAETVAQCETHHFRPIGTLMLKGKSMGIEAFEPVSTHSHLFAYRHEYQQAFELIRNDDPRAVNVLENLNERFPQDALVSYHVSRLRARQQGTRIVFDAK